MAVRRSRKARNAPVARSQGKGKNTLIVVLLVFLVVLGYLGYAGLFTRVTVTEEEAGPFSLMLTSQTGDYSQTPATIKKMMEAAKSVGIEPEAACGVFLDNPREVKTADLRAQIGLVIQPADRDKVRRLPADITFKSIPRGNCLTAVFPFRTAFSVKLGIMRVYPALERAAKEKALAPVPALEIYRKGDSVTYLMPVVPAK